MKAGLNPVRLYLSGFDWTGRTTRVQFLIVAGFSLAPTGVGRLLSVDNLTGGWMSTVLTVWLALAIVPLVGHGLRRAGDAGLNAWLMWLAVVPLVNIALLVVLLTWPTNARRLPEASRLRLLGLPIAALVGLAVLSRLVLVPVAIETADMMPTLEPGDVALIWRRDHDATLGSLAVLIDPNTNAPVVRRVIAGAGARVAMASGVPVVDGTPTQQVARGFHQEIMEPRGPLGALPRCLSGSVGQGGLCEKRMIAETLATGRGYLVLDIGPSDLDTFTEQTVPQGALFVLSDNRDAATDSRIAPAAGGLGMVDIGSVRGRVAFVLGSFRGRSGWQVWTWRPERFLKGVL